MSSIAVKIEGPEDIRRLTAALENFNVGEGLQVAQLVRDRDNAIAVLEGKKPLPCLATDLLSPLGIAAYAARVEVEGKRKKVGDQAESLKSKDGQIEALQIDLKAALDQCKTLQQAAKCHHSKLAEKADQIDRMSHALRVKERRIDTLEEANKYAQSVQDHAIKMMRGERPAVFVPDNGDNQLLRGVVDLIHKFNSNAMAAISLQAERDDLRAELAAAEAEIAKRDPLIKAIRDGHVYAAYGEWVIPDVAENERASVRIHFNAEDKKCL